MSEDPAALITGQCFHHMRSREPNPQAYDARSRTGSSKLAVGFPASRCRRNIAAELSARSAPLARGKLRTGVCVELSGNERRPERA
jgi:hypothetical protein